MSKQAPANTPTSASQRQSPGQTAGEPQRVTPQGVRRTPGLLAPADVLRLQRGIGNRATARLLARATPPTAPALRLQRKTEPEWFNQSDSTFNTFATEAAKLVEAVAEQARKDPKGLNENFNDAFTSLWWKTCQEYAEGKDVEFLYARYGYAIETVVSPMIKRLSLPKGYRVELQQTRGQTRPDIVVMDSKDNDIGWFDITSEDSAAHIYDKVGSGWSRHPYVAEFQYTPLDVSKIGEGGADKSFAEKIQNTNKQEAEARRKIERTAEQLGLYLAMLFDQVLVYTNNQMERKGLTRDFIKEALSFEDVDHKAFNSILSLANLYSIDFGYKKDGWDLKKARSILYKYNVNASNAKKYINTHVEEKKYKDTVMEIE